jgi:hypothetical protein
MNKFPSKVITISYGKALVASKDLPKGTIVEKFEGKIIKLSQVPIEMIRHAIFVGEKDSEDKWIVSETNAICANHACEPNCEIDDDLNIITLKKVKKDEELTYIYNKLEDDEKVEDFTWDERWNFECKCGSKKCQKLINGYKKV